MKLLFLLIFCLSSAAEATLLVSGEFGDLSIAYNPKTHQVSGVYTKSLDENPDCRFAFSGLQRGNVVPIQTFSFSNPKEVLSGALSVTKNGAIKLILSAEPSGCHGAPFLSEKRNPATFKFSQRKVRLYLRVLKQSNPTIYPGPEITKGPVQKWKAGDILEIVESHVDWLRLARISEGNYSWIHESNFIPLFEGDLRDIDKQ